MTEPSRSVVHLVPHTHWDREWYRPFQSFRMQLVELVDSVLEMLAADERFAFTLDGQLATVDDYLEIRPDREAELRRFVKSGRLAVGPWQILMDEFLVSAETMIRNLQIGHARAEALGGAMPVGYLPDMFGHVAQMPQLLRRAGIDRAVVWRGVPAAVDWHRFAWTAPDGSTVTAEYLNEGYGSAAYLLAIPERLGDKLAIFAAHMRPFFGDDPLLAMYGADHAAPLPELMKLVDAVNAADEEYAITVDTLSEYLSAQSPEASLPRWSGELRSSARANMLMGVNSARIDLKQAAGRAERLLERYAEPLQAVWGEPDAWPSAYLRLAWRRMVENSAHDSICGCSLDAVVSQVLVRYAEVEQIAAGLAERAAAHVARSVPRGAVVVLNPSFQARDGLVELSLPIPEGWGAICFETADGHRAPTQELERSEQLIYTRDLPGREIPVLLDRRLHGAELFGRHLRGYTIGEVHGVRIVTLEVDVEPEHSWLDLDAMRHAIQTAVSGDPDAVWRLRVAALPRRRVLTQLSLPALGYRAVRPVNAECAVADPVHVEARRLHNDHLEVRLREDGTFDLASVDGISLLGIGRLVDGGDAGDSYNYGPPPTDALVEVPSSVTSRILLVGPLRGALAVTRTFHWPVGLSAQGMLRSDARVEVSVRTVLELRSGEPFARVQLSFENRSEDHRLRFHIPLPVRADTSFAEGQLAVVERRGTPDAGHGEVPLPTYPARTFVSAGNVAVLAEHTIEYELLEERELAITVLRATGLISRNANPHREDPAGPEIAIPGGQCRGPWSYAFGIRPHAGDWAGAELLRDADRYAHPILAAPGTADAAVPLPDGGMGLSVDGRGVTVSALRRIEEELELRLACEDPDAQLAVIRGRFSAAREVDLLGHEVGVVAVASGEVRLPMGAWEIRTLRLR